MIRKKTLYQSLGGDQMKPISVGVQAMMLKGEFAQHGAYETIKKVRETGYRSIEISQIPMTKENILSMNRAQADFGVKINATSASVYPSGIPGEETLTTHFEKIVADNHALGCDFIRIGMLPFSCMADLDKVLAFCKTANETAKALKKEGIRLYYHNHHIEFMKFGAKTMLDIISENADELGFEIDVHWAHRGGFDPVKLIEAYKGRVDLIHLKDYRIAPIAPEAFAALGKGDFGAFMQGFTGNVQFAEVGEGTLDMPAIIEASLEAGAKYFFVEQDNLYGKDVFDCLTVSKNNLNKMGYELM